MLYKRQNASEATMANRGGGGEPSHALPLYARICTLDNLERAYERARRRKTYKPYVKAFEEHLSDNLGDLQADLVTQTYRPKPLKTFILRDPKTRRISKSDFRDRIVHHAICNVIEPIFDKTFIYDSCANRKGKGTLKAIQRFDTFKRKASRNFTRPCSILKADVKHYFDTVNHAILLELLARKINCEPTLALIKTILDNHLTPVPGKGMPLGNLTSQFFANVYLNELDQYVKHHLKAEYYIRYVDDFVILHHDSAILQAYKERIDTFLRKELALELHPDKSSIKQLHRGVGFLGFRIFEHHKLVRKKNLNRFHRRFETFKADYKLGFLERERVITSIEGWIAYIKHANTYKYRRHLIRQLNHHFPAQPTTVPIKVKKHAKTAQAIAASNIEYTVQKTAHLFRQKKTITQIAEQRGIKESTVWSHLANLIEHNQLSLWHVLSREKITMILPHIHATQDTLKDIKARIADPTIAYDEIACVLAYMKSKHKKRNFCQLIQWYQNTHCHRKCYHNKPQRIACQIKFARLAGTNPDMLLSRQEFLDLFNNHINICVLPDKEKRKYVTYQEFKKRKQTSAVHSPSQPLQAGSPSNNSVTPKVTCRLEYVHSTSTLFINDRRLSWRPMMARFDPHGHERAWHSWKAKGMPLEGLTAANAGLIRRFLEDMEVGANVNPGSKRGSRSYGRLRNLKSKLHTLAAIFQNDLSMQAWDDLVGADRELLVLTKRMRDGHILARKNGGKPLQAVGTYVKVLKAFWHWYQRAARKEGREIKDVTIDLDGRDEKPKFNYFTLDDLKKLCDAARQDYKVLMLFLYDSGIRAPTEQMNVRVEDLEWSTKHSNYTLTIRDEAAKTFGRKIKLLLCSEQLRNHIAAEKLGPKDYVFTRTPFRTNQYLKQLGHRVLGIGKATQKHWNGRLYHVVQDGLTMYDFRHASACYWLPRYKSESALKYRFGWKKSDMIHYYTELLGMKDTIQEDDLYVDITKTELERGLQEKGKEIELLQEQLQNQDAKMKEILQILEAIGKDKLVEQKIQL